MLVTGQSQISLVKLMELEDYRGYRIDSIELIARSLDGRSVRVVLRADGIYMGRATVAYERSYSTNLLPDYAIRIGRDYVRDLTLDTDGSIFIDEILIYTLE